MYFELVVVVVVYHVWNAFVAIRCVLQNKFLIVYCRTVLDITEKFFYLTQKCTEIALNFNFLNFVLQNALN